MSSPVSSPPAILWENHLDPLKRFHKVFLRINVLGCSVAWGAGNTISSTALLPSNTHKNYKGQLQEHCQKIKVELPQYTVESIKTREACTFHATVTVMGQSFTSSGGFTTKKQAEQDVAKVAVRCLNLSSTDDMNSDGGCIRPQESSPLPTPGENGEVSGAVKGNPSNVQRPQCATTKLCTSPVSYKNRLQEFAQKWGFAIPIYDTQGHDGIFHICCDGGRTVL